ncbi:MAG: xanthine dehydrogenase family protein subunit M [Clostridia bacterium]|nr:xanthine dehydrogenase family protein subunit M [Clostridia bacterium]
MNILTPFEYFAPETLDEALELLATKENAKVIAGGTDLVVQLKEKIIHPANVIDIKHIPELNEFKVEDGKGAVIGACTTDAFCEFSKELQAKFPAFSYAAGEIGGPQVREMGTIGGNLSNSGPSAETPASLICYRAQLVLVSKEGERTIPVEDFITGNRKNCLKPGEIIKTIILPEPDKNTYVKYAYVGLRRSMEIDVANMCIRLDVDGDTIKDAMVVMGSVAIKPLISEAVPAVLKGTKIGDEEVIKKAAEAAQSEVHPITDVRASAQYRVDVIGALTRRILRDLADEIKK